MAEEILDIKPTRQPREHYIAPATIVWCFDAGFLSEVKEFCLKRGLDFERIDLITEPGGAKNFVSPVKEALRESLVWRVQTSLKLHHSGLVILQLHSDCGAYGGIQAFNNSFEMEEANHKQDGKAAESYLKNFLPTDIRIESWFSDFSKLSRI